MRISPEIPRALPALIALALLAFASALLASPAFAEPTVSGSVWQQARLRILESKRPDDASDASDFTLMMTGIDLVGRASNDDGTGRLFVNADLRFDPISIEFDNGLESRLREAYGGWYTPYFSLEVGKKIFAWGKADEFNPTDLINPEDYRWFITFDKPQRKIGVPMAAATVSYDAWSLQGVAIPVFTPALLPDPASDWLPWQLALQYDIAAAMPDLVTLQRGNTPEPKAENVQGAARLSGSIGRFDLEAVAFDGFDPLPTYDVRLFVDPELYLAGESVLVMREEFQRYQAYGGSAAFTAGKFAFRTEAAYSTPRWWMHELDPALADPSDLPPMNVVAPIILDAEWRSRKASWSGAAGVDWRSGTELYINLQYTHTQILDHDDVLLDPENEGMVTLKVQTRWLDDDLEISADGAYNVWHNDRMMKPYVRYKFTADFSGELGAQLFAGEHDTRFGEFDHNDYGYTTFRYTF